MWTLPLFTRLHTLLDPARSCIMPTYSRSTLLRTTLLLAGFFVGRGRATGEKEETTIAANDLRLIEAPLDRVWLQRCRNSTSAEPMQEPVYRQSKLSDRSWELLGQHAQFRLEAPAASAAVGSAGARARAAKPPGARQPATDARAHHRRPPDTGDRARRVRDPPAGRRRAGPRDGGRYARGRGALGAGARRLRGGARPGARTTVGGA